MAWDRRQTMKLAAIAAAGLGASGGAARDPSVPLSTGKATKNDFDYFIGNWRVEHRRLRKRLAANNEWEEFAGKTRCQRMFDGLLNLNESISYRGGRTSYGMGLRGFDERRARWADWTLSASDLSTIDPPQYGRFENGVGTFFSREIFEGRPVLVRGQFRSVTDEEARWEQAFSPDDGTTWETNWIMRYLRVR